MNATVVNFDSSFAWEADVQAILDPLDGPGIARALNLPGEAQALADRLGRLRRFFLVSDLTLDSQASAARQNRVAELGKPRDKAPWEVPARRKSSDRGRDVPWSRFGEPPVYTSGGISEAFGIYTRDAKGLLLRLGRHSRKRPPFDADAVGEGEPGVFLCPERIFGLPADLAMRLDPSDPRPRAHENQVPMFLRMTVYHEIGHHLFPAFGDGAAIYLSEALANTLTQALITEEERAWLFAKAWQLQPAPYLAYHAPRFLDSASRSAGGDDLWREVLTASLHGRSVSRRWLQELEDEIDVRLDGARPVASARMYVAVNGLLCDLTGSGRPFFTADHRPCAFTAFEEHAEAWVGDGLPDLLDHPEPSIQAEAFHRLGLRREPSAALRQAMQAWCDANLTSADEHLARRAWQSPLAHRADGIEARYREVARLPHDEIVAELPARAHDAGARGALEALRRHKNPEIRLTAVEHLAALLYAQGDAAAYEALLRGINEDVAGSYRSASGLRYDEHMLAAAWRPAKQGTVLLGAPFVADVATGQLQAQPRWQPAAEMRALADEAAGMLTSGRVDWGSAADVAQLLPALFKHNLPQIVDAVIEHGAASLDDAGKADLLSKLTERSVDSTSVLVPRLIRRYRIYLPEGMLAFHKKLYGAWWSDKSALVALRREFLEACLNDGFERAYEIALATATAADAEAWAREHAAAWLADWLLSRSPDQSRLVMAMVQDRFDSIRRWKTSESHGDWGFTSLLIAPLPLRVALWNVALQEPNRSDDIFEMLVEVLLLGSTDEPAREVERNVLREALSSDNSSLTFHAQYQVRKLRATPGKGDALWAHVAWHLEQNLDGISDRDLVRAIGTIFFVFKSLPQGLATFSPQGRRAFVAALARHERLTKTRALDLVFNSPRESGTPALVFQACQDVGADYLRDLALAILGADRSGDTGPDETLRDAAKAWLEAT